MKQKSAISRFKLASAPVAAAVFAAVFAMEGGIQNASAAAASNPSAADVSQQAKAGQQSAAMTQEQMRNYRGVRASELIGQKVENTRGESLGAIEDVIVHMSTGDVRYAVMKVADAQAGDKLYAVPLRMIKLTEVKADAQKGDAQKGDAQKGAQKDAQKSGAQKTQAQADAQKHKLVIDMDRQRLAQQKWWLADRWPGLQDSIFWGEIDRLSGMPAVQPAQAYYAYRLSDLIGKDIDNFQGRHLGTVRDAVIDMNTQKVHYVVLGFQPYIGLDTNKLFAAPIHALVFLDGNPNRLALNVERDRLLKLAGFDPARWPDVNDPKFLEPLQREFIVIFPVQQKPSGGVGATR